MDDHLRPMEELLRIPIIAGGNLMSKKYSRSLNHIENKAKVRTCRNKPQVSSSGGTLTKIDAITALTKQVEALLYHISSMQEAYNRNQEAPIQLMRTQMGQLEEAFQERPSCVPLSNTVTKPLAELNVITSMDGLTLDGSFIPHSSFLAYQEEEHELETITEVVEIPRAHHLVDIVNSLCDKFRIENNSLSGNPTPYFDSVVESLSLLSAPCGDSDSLMEKTDTLLSHFNDSSPDYETFFFGIEEKSSGSTISYSYHSLLEYKSFCFDIDHIEEKSSGSTTSRSDLSLLEYESFHFDLSTDQLPPADRSDFYHKEFTDEIAHIISLPEYDHFYFDLEVDQGELTRLLKDNISDTLTKDLKIHELNNFPLFLSDCDSIFFEIDLLVLFPSGDKGKVFDPGIFAINGVHSKRFSFLLLDDFSSILFVRDFLFLTDPVEIKTFLSFLFGNEDKVFDPKILLNNGIFSFTRKSPHLLIDNFMIDNCHIFSEISLKIISSISFHPKEKEIRGESS
uniref:Reverse transcriptase domain-containing protein n=1 Tax=Tanacetum cinerariifolium TaxID=118510 RepID=A0A699HUL9_TANCI|nr:hypothetical protein [Tanacetum cinerariifolium]